MNKINDAIKHYEGNKIDREIIITVTDKKTALAALKTIKWALGVGYLDGYDRNDLKDKFYSFQMENY